MKKTLAIITLILWCVNIGAFFMKAHMENQFRQKGSCVNEYICNLNDSIKILEYNIDSLNRAVTDYKFLIEINQ